MWRLCCCCFNFSCVVQFVKFLLIYLNDLNCFRVLYFMFVLSCGNSSKDYSVFFSGVSVGNQSLGYRFLA